MTAPECDEPRHRAWRPDFAVDLARMVRPLRRGGGDPTQHREPAGRLWLATNTPDGPATLTLGRGGGDVLADAWGPGATRLLDGLPALLGADDDDRDFVAHHPLVAEARRRNPGLRLGATGRVWDVLVAAVLEQKVTGTEAHRSWRELCRRFGTAAPGPAPAGLFVPPTARTLMTLRDWEWHRCGVDGARRRALVAVAQVAGRLETAVELRGEPGRALLRKVPGIGVWTAAEVAQRAWGDPDAVSVGDFHIPSVVGHALVGRPLDDDGMLEVLAPYAPHRQRAVRYVELSGVRRERRGPRFSPRDYRGM